MILNPSPSPSPSLSPTPTPNLAVDGGDEVTGK